MKFTVDKLIQARACQEQVDLFRETFPDGAEVSVDTAVSVAEIFDWDFAAMHFLSIEGTKVYNKAEAPFWETYYKTVAPLWETCLDVDAPCLESYNEARDLLWRTYKRACARVFAELYIKENNGK